MCASLELVSELIAGAKTITRKEGRPGFFC